MHIRLAKIKDLVKIVEIYNQAIPSKSSTGDTVLFKPEERIDWFNSHTPDKYPIFVAEIAEKVVGWISISPYRQNRGAFDYTAEISYYIEKKHHRKGIASELLQYAMTQCSALKINTLVAYIMEHNTASIKLMEKFGFERWGVLPNTAIFDGDEFNHTIYGKRVPF
ncbi:MAG: N-acetyltransferase family protein [Bacteroidota bacterium]